MTNPNAVNIPVGWKPLFWNTKSSIISNGTINAHCTNEKMSATTAIFGYIQYLWIIFFSLLLIMDITSVSSITYFWMKKERYFALTIFVS